jgi:hypothetical protein
MGAVFGGLFGLLFGAAFLAIPGFGPLIILGPLAAGVVGAAEGAVGTGWWARYLAPSCSSQHIPKVEQYLRAGRYLVLVHGSAEDVARAQEILRNAGSIEVSQHDHWEAAAAVGSSLVRDLPVISRALTRSSMVPKPEPATIDGRGSAVGVDTVVALRVLDRRNALYESRTLPHLWPVRFADSSRAGLWFGARGLFDCLCSRRCSWSGLPPPSLGVRHCPGDQDCQCD